MTLRNGSTATLGRFLAVVTGLIFLAGCSNSGGGGGGTPSTPVANTVAVEVNSGPANNSVNMAFADVTLCMPGTTNCQTISNIEVDTGSSGLRLLSSAVNLTLPTIADSGKNVLQECIQFADTSYVWGPVAVADIQMAGEKASSVPLQLINAPNSGFAVPSSCLSGGSGPSLNTVAELGGNGILGISNFPQDCGSACSPNSANVLPVYYTCPNGVCGVVGVATNYQLQNPVWLFPQDNNGALISLPSIPAGGQPTVSGSLIFGIGTQTDNALGSAQIYATDDLGNIQTTYPTTDSVSYPGFLDTGSTGFYFLDATTLAPAGIIECSDAPGWYCPSSPVDFTVTNRGSNGTSGPLTFSIANADTLFSNLDNWAFNNLGGDSGTDPSTDYADFGMPFFYGRNVFIGIMGTTVPNGVSAPYGYYAY
jgi:hypothetical protein